MIAQPLFSSSTIAAIILSVIITGFLTWRLSPKRFNSIHWVLFGLVSGVYWAVFAALLITWSWEFYYQHFAPDWYRYAAPAGALLLYALIGILLRWAAIRLPGHPVLWFCALGGLEAIPEHLVGTYRFKILSVPLLKDSSAGSILVFAYFEYVVYWSIVLLLVIGVSRLIETLQKNRVNVDN